MLSGHVDASMKVCLGSGEFGGGAGAETCKSGLQKQKIPESLSTGRPAAQISQGP